MTRRSLVQEIAALFGLLTAAALVVSAFFGYEEVLLSKNKRPITWYTRRLLNKHWAAGRLIEAGAMFTIGVAFTHFVLDSDKQPGGN